MHIVSPEAYLEMMERGVPLPRNNTTPTLIARAAAFTTTLSSCNELEISLGIHEGSYTDFYVPFGCKMPTTLSVESAFIAQRGQWLHYERDEDANRRELFTPYETSLPFTTNRSVEVLEAYLQHRWVFPNGDLEDIDPFDLTEHTPRFFSISVQETPRPAADDEDLTKSDTVPTSPSSDGSAGLTEFLCSIEFISSPESFHEVTRSEMENETKVLEAVPYPLEEENKKASEEVSAFHFFGGSEIDPSVVTRQDLLNATEALAMSVVAALGIY